MSCAIAMFIPKPNAKVANKTLIINQVKCLMINSPFFSLFQVVVNKTRTDANSSSHLTTSHLRLLHLSGVISISG